MPKLPSVTFKKLVKILKSRGFLLDHTTGSHFIFYNPQDKKRAVLPCHVKDLPKGTLMNILRESGITSKEFKDLLK